MPRVETSPTRTGSCPVVVKSGAGLLIKRIVNRTLLPLWNQLYLDLGNGPADAVFLAGTERSGTTWVADTINYDGSYRFMFEPFWGQKVPASSVIGPQEYIRPCDRSADKVAAATRIISGKIRNAWVDGLHRAFFARRRLLKDVRSNLYLKWLKSLFPDMPMILLIRHPCAVAKSQIERKHGFAPTEKTFLSQPDLVEDYLGPFADDIRQSRSPFEDRIFRWCIQNFVPLKQFRNDELHVVFYERLCVDPAAEYQSIMNYLNVPFDNRIVMASSSPSPMSQQESAVNTGASLVDSWRNSVSSADASAAVDILRLFGLDSMYGESSMPSEDAISQVMRS